MKINPTRVQIRGLYGAQVMAASDVDSGAKKVVKKKKKGGKRVVGIKGFGIDLNSDGRINAAQDGFLAFKNSDGSHNVRYANRLLKAFAGDFDLNADGKLTRNEKQRARALRKQAGSLDLDGDSVLSNWELRKAGAVVVQNPGSFGAREIELPTLMGEPQQNNDVGQAAPYQPPYVSQPPAFPWTVMFPFSVMNPFMTRWPFFF